MAVPTIEIERFHQPAADASGGWDADWADFDNCECSREHDNNTAVQYPTVTALDKGGVRALFDFERSDEENGTITVMVTCRSSLATHVNNFMCRAAVPKGLKIIMGPPSSSTLGPSASGAITQTMKISNLRELGVVSLRGVLTA